MLSAMPQPNKPIVFSGRAHPHSEPGELGIPDTILARLRRQFSPREITVQKGSSPAFFPIGDHMAIECSRTVCKSPRILRITGAHLAIGGYRPA